MQSLRQRQNVGIIVRNAASPLLPTASVCPTFYIGQKLASLDQN